MTLLHIKNRRLKKWRLKRRKHNLTFVKEKRDDITLLSQKVCLRYTSIISPDKKR